MFNENNYGSLTANKRLQGLINFNLESTQRHIVDNERIRSEKDLSKIYFGCGDDYRQGWVNIDVNDKADYWLDLRNKINIEDNSIDFIMSSHTVEHLEHYELIFHLTECYRMLKKGGKIRIGIPNYPAVIDNYRNNEFLEKNKKYLPSELFDNLPEELICYMDLLNRAFYEFGTHKLGLDVEKMTNLLIFTGFERKNITEKEFQKEIDNPGREGTTLYVEAVK